MAINRQRRRIVGSDEVDLDALEASGLASPEEHAESAERVARTAEALHSLKPQEVRAIWLKALGHSYEQIAESTGWPYTQVDPMVVSSPLRARISSRSPAGGSSK